MAAIVAPVRAMPVGAVVVSVPPQTVDVEFATVSPVGSVSVNATPVSGSGLPAGLVIVNVSEVVAFSAIDEGLNTNVTVFKDKVGAYLNLCCHVTAKVRLRLILTAFLITIKRNFVCFLQV